MHDFALAANVCNFIEKRTISATSSSTIARFAHQHVCNDFTSWGTHKVTLKIVVETDQKRHLGRINENKVVVKYWLLTFF
jgi:hypothetical protein